MRRIRLLASIALGSMLVLGLAACGDDDEESSTTTTVETVGETTTSAAGGGSDEGDTLEIADFAFPSDFTVAAGAEVEVRHNDSAEHTVTADDDSFDTDRIAGGEDGSFTAPSEPGEYAYHCDVHGDMKATLVVT